jgi:phage gp29-like protein
MTRAARASIRSFARDLLGPALSEKPDQAILTPNPFHTRDADFLGARLTPAELTTIIQQRNEGYLQRWVDFANEAREKDTHLHSQLALREQSVVETEFEIQPGAGSNRRAALRAVDACEELFEHWSTLGGDGEDRAPLHDWLARWTGAAFYPAGLDELVWERADGELYLVGCEEVAPRRLSYACDPHDSRPWALRLHDAGYSESIFSDAYGVPLVDLPQEKLLVTRRRVRGAEPTREGIFAVIVWQYLFKHWAWRDVMSLAELIGRPPVVGYYNAGGAKADGELAKGNGPRNASKEDIAALRKAINGLSGSLRAVLADTTRVDTLKYELPTTPIQLEISREIDAAVSKAIHGVANLSDLKAGARAAVEAQERTSYTFWRSDCRIAQRNLSRLFALYIRANPQRFGAECPLPIARAKVEPAADTVAVIDGIERAQRVGIQVPRAWAHRAAQIPEPTEKRGVLEPVLKPKPAAAPAAQPSPAVAKRAPAEAKTNDVDA